MNLKQRLRKKLKKNGGFTLIEMLIVVAIIAILVVVSIPMVSSSLDKAKSATDDANLRAAKAAGVIEYMTNGTAATMNYNADEGKLESSGTATTPYGQSDDHKGEYVVVTIASDGTVTAKWSGD